MRARSRPATLSSATRTCPIGSLGLVPDGTIILRHSAPLKDLEPDEFDVPLQAITQGGDMLERELAVADRF